MTASDEPDDTHLLPFTERIKAAKARLDADPDNVELKLETAEALDELGDALFNQDELDRTRFFYWQSFVMRLEVMKQRPDDPAAEGYFAVGLDKLGVLFSRLGEIEEADNLLTEAVERRRRLADHFDDDIASAHLVVVSLLSKAGLERIRDQPDAERPLLEEAQLRLKRALERWPDREFLARDHAEATARLAELQAGNS